MRQVALPVVYSFGTDLFIIDVVEGKFAVFAACPLKWLFSRNAIKVEAK